MRASTLLLFLLSACSATPGDTAGEGPPAFDRWSPPDDVGRYGVAVQTMEWTDARGKELKADIWYPAVVEEDDQKGYYESFLPALEVYRSLPIDTRGGPHPVLAFSHGMQAIRFQSASTMEYLASHGWVVVAPDHPYNTPLDWDESKMPQALEDARRHRRDGRWAGDPGRRAGRRLGGGLRRLALRRHGAQPGLDHGALGRRGCGGFRGGLRPL